jgi:26S proteasome regulatory subunit N6
VGLRLGACCLVIFEDSKADEIFPATLETISIVGKVVDSLYLRSAKIMP